MDLKGHILDTIEKYGKASFSEGFIRIATSNHSKTELQLTYFVKTLAEENGLVLEHEKIQEKKSGTVLGIVYTFKPKKS